MTSNVVCNIVYPNSGTLVDFKILWGQGYVLGVICPPCPLIEILLKYLVIFGGTLSPMSSYVLVRQQEIGIILW